jgi:flagellar biosynthetic protein FlhB
MADFGPADNRTEEPTPRRRQQARAEGRIARSAELTGAVMLLAGASFTVSVGGRWIGEHLLDLFRSSPGWSLAEPPGLIGAVGLLRQLVLGLLAAALPVAAALMLVALGVGLGQSRGVVSWKPVRPDPSRLHPVNGLRRIFGAEAALNLVKSVLKLAALGLLAYLVLRAAVPGFTALADAPPIAMAGAIRGAVVRLALTVGLAFLALGGLDYFVQLIRVERGLKMTRQEVVQEHREQEGDPQIKARIRQIARQRARQRMLAAVPKADVVITNPTHVAVALTYELGTAAAPLVVAMGERKLAERIKLIAARAGVPILENPPLARALQATCRVGAPIPPALYLAVAEVLAFVYRMRGRRSRTLGAGADRSAR